MARSPVKRITEDDPRWNASTMGNRTGWYKGVYYKNGKPFKPSSTKPASVK